MANLDIYVMSKFTKITSMENRIRELRALRGLTMAQLAEAAGTDASTINKLEKGKTKLADHWKRRIAPALDVQPFELMPDAPLPNWVAELREGGFAQIEDEVLTQKKVEMVKSSKGGRAEKVNRTMNTSAISPQVDLVPVKGTAHAALAAGVFPEGGFHLNVPVDYVPRPPSMTMTNGYAIYVTGESMVPEHPPGQLRFAVPRSPKAGDSALIYIKDFESDELRVYLKTYVRQEDEFYVTTQHNPPATIRFNAGTVLQVHKVLTISEMYGR